MNALGKFTTASLSACLMLGTAGTQASASEVSSVPPGPSSGLEHVQSEPAGQYYYSCTATNGSVYWLTPGEPTTNCRGSYLGKYINGARVASYNLTEGGMRAAPRAEQLAVIDCMLAAVGATTAVLTTAGTAGWLLSATASAWGLRACSSA